MVADSLKIDPISTQQTPAPAPAESALVSAPVKTTGTHINLTDGDAPVSAPSAPSISASTGARYTTVPFHSEGSFSKNQNDDGWCFDNCKNNIDMVKANAELHIQRLTVNAMTQKAKPVISLIDENNTFGSKQGYEVADCNIPLKDLKSSPLINKYFSVLAMPSSHGNMFGSSVSEQPAYTLVVTSRETGKVLSGPELANFYTFAANTLQAENEQQLA